MNSLKLRIRAWWTLLIWFFLSCNLFNKIFHIFLTAVFDLLLFYFLRFYCLALLKSINYFINQQNIGALMECYQSVVTALLYVLDLLYIFVFSWITLPILGITEPSCVACQHQHHHLWGQRPAHTSVQTDSAYVSFQTVHHAAFVVPDCMLDARPCGVDARLAASACNRRKGGPCHSPLPIKTYPVACLQSPGPWQQMSQLGLKTKSQCRVHAFTAQTSQSSPFGTIHIS